MEISFRLLNGLQPIQPQTYVTNSRITITEIKTNLSASLEKPLGNYKNIKLCYMGKFFKNDSEMISLENYKPGHPIIVSFSVPSPTNETQMNLETTEGQSLLSYNQNTELANYNVTNDQCLQKFGYSSQPSAGDKFSKIMAGQNLASKKHFESLLKRLQHENVLQKDSLKSVKDWNSLIIHIEEYWSQKSNGNARLRYSHLTDLNKNDRDEESRRADEDFVHQDAMMDQED
jgi:hypothetical protein